MERRQAQPLAGVRVLEFSHVIAGPFAGLQLQVLGAEVTKVEAPGAGDFLRGLPHGQRAYQALNGGKRIVTLDLDSSGGAREAAALAAQADVLIDSFSPGSLARRGLDYRLLCAHNPGLIYCSISGYGVLAPAWGERGAYDHVIQAMTGMAWLSGLPDDPPLKVGFPLTDTATGMCALSAVLAALLERQRSGEGQFLEVSMARAALQLMYPMAADSALTGSVPPRIGNRGYTGSPGAAFFRCRDGWLSLGGNTGAQIQRARQALGLDESGDAATALSAALAALDADAAEQLMVAAGVPAAALRTLPQFLREAADRGWMDLPGSDPQAWASALACGWRSFSAPRDTDTEGDRTCA